MDTTVQPVQKTWKPIAAGILDIVGGAFSILGSIGVIIGFMFFLPVYTAFGPGPIPEFGRWLIPGVLETIIFIAAVFLFIVGILPIIGGGTLVCCGKEMEQID